MCSLTCPPMLHARRRSVGVLLHVLEPRRLLAYSLSDYFPTAASPPVDFAGTWDQNDTTASVSVGPDTFGGKSVTDLAITATADGETLNSRTFFSRASDGLHINGLYSLDDGTEVIVTPASPPRILNATINNSDTLPFGPTA